MKKDKGNQVTVYQKQAITIKEKVSELIIDSPTEHICAENLLKDLYSFRSAVKDHKEKTLGPIRDALEKSEEEYNKVIKNADTAILTVKQKVGAYVEKENNRRQKEAEEANSKAIKGLKQSKAAEIKRLIKSGDVEEAAALSKEVLPVVVVQPEALESSDGIQHKHILAYTVVDESKIPIIYFKPRELDTKKIRQDGYAGKEIPGIIFYKKPIIAVKIETDN